MTIPKREDFTDWCKRCKSTGEVSRRVRVGGWAGSNETIHETCPDCKGKKVFFDEHAYFLAVEAFAIQCAEQGVEADAETQCHYCSFAKSQYGDKICPKCGRNLPTP